MTALTDTLKKMLNALACADAGEFLSPGQKTECLNRALGRPAAEVEPAAAAPAQVEAATPATPARRRVALYMGSELPADMMNYIMQTCARLKHGLTVLTFQPEDEGRALLKPYNDALASAGIDLQLEALSGDPVPGLSRYLRAHPEIAFLACRETGYLGRSFLNGTQRKNALPVPVVLIEAHAPGAIKPVLPAEQGQSAGSASVA